MRLLQLRQPRRYRPLHLETGRSLAARQGRTPKRLRYSCRGRCRDSGCASSINRLSKTASCWAIVEVGQSLKETDAALDEIRNVFIFGGLGVFSSPSSPSMCSPAAP